MFVNSGPFSQAGTACPSRDDGRAMRRRIDMDGRARGDSAGLPVAVSIFASGKIPGGEDVAIPDPLLPLEFAAAITKQDQARNRRHDPSAAPSDLRGQGSGDARRALARAHDPRNRQRLARRRSSARWASIFIRAARAPTRRSRRCAHCGATIRRISTASISISVRSKSFPKPAQKGGVPIHVGGHSPAAARRAGRSATASSRRSAKFRSSRNCSR